MALDGIFKCFAHEFSTDHPSEWREHKQNYEHEEVGKAPCNQCDRPTSFVYKGKQSGKKPPALCPECKKQLVEGSL